MLPVLIFVGVAIPVLVIAFLAVRKSRAEGEATVESEAQLEDEFADAERYQEQWREEQRKHPHDESLY